MRVSSDVRWHNGALVNAIFLATILLLVTATEAAVEEQSLPESTRLSVLAKDAKNDVVATEPSVTITREESTVSFTVVEVVSVDRRTAGGIRMSLQSGSQAVETYLDSSQARQIRDEFTGLEDWNKIIRYRQVSPDNTPPRQLTRTWHALAAVPGRLDSP